MSVSYLSIEENVTDVHDDRPDKHHFSGNCGVNVPNNERYNNRVSDFVAKVRAEQKQVIPKFIGDVKIQVVFLPHAVTVGLGLAVL